MTTPTILRIDASARQEGSISRDLADRIVRSLGAVDVIERDLATAPLPQIDETWVGANFTAPDERTEVQKKALSLSDDLIGELQSADIVVVGLPIYNFSIPTSLKAWIDLVARAGVTFKYTEQGPQGLLSGKSVKIAFASGGVPQGSDYDFASDYLRHVFGFLGITDVEIVTSEQFESAA